MDPLVERAILHCLEADPENRPASALMVSAALPGGDPLAAALAAGETPSPQVVAASGNTSGLPVRTALLATAAALIGLIIFFACSAATSGMAKIDMPDSSEVLAQRAATSSISSATLRPRSILPESLSGTTITLSTWTTPAASIPTGTWSSSSGRR